MIYVQSNSCDVIASPIVDVVRYCNLSLHQCDQQ